MRHDRWIVLTSIQQPTAALRAMADLCGDKWGIVVVGDTKTPAEWSQPGVKFLSVQRQHEMFGALAELIPSAHYCRKNLGYLYAIRNGAELIIDMDDDNIPYDSFASHLNPTVNGRLLSGAEWVNVYKQFIENTPIWPRGLPLDEIETAGKLSAEIRSFGCPIQQFLADGDPDVDAIFRLTTPGQFFFRKEAQSVVLERKCWSPFNSQNTLFFPQAFPLLYLPCHVSFRMTDIWRSFVAQAALWHYDLRVAFHAPSVRQQRNEHDLHQDLAQELPGYIHNRRIARTLSEARRNISPDQPLAETALRLWQSLEGIGIIAREEMSILQKWLAQTNQLAAAR